MARIDWPTRATQGFAEPEAGKRVSAKTLLYSSHKALNDRCGGCNGIKEIRLMAIIFVCGALLSRFFLRLIVMQPIPLGLLLLLRSGVLCVIVRLEMRRLLGLLLFITYVRGVMVLFLYVLRIYPNEIYSVDLKSGLAVVLMRMGGCVIIVKDLGNRENQRHLSLAFINDL